jgi:hypothetical protein
MAAHPRVSRFLAEHPKTSRFIMAHLIPVLDRYVRPPSRFAFLTPDVRADQRSEGEYSPRAKRHASLRAS